MVSPYQRSAVKYFMGDILSSLERKVNNFLATNPEWDIGYFHVRSDGKCIQQLYLSSPLMDKVYKEEE
jgi:hypothetical protein